MQLSVESVIGVLERTPPSLRALLKDAPEELEGGDEGEDTWSPFDIVGHLIHGERTDWIPRVRLILEEDESREFTPFDRFAHFDASRGKSLEDLLAEFEKQPTENQPLIAAAMQALGRSASPKAQALLRKLYDEKPDDREILARFLARHPSLENLPYLLRTLQFGDEITLQECLRALGNIDHKLEKPNDIRAVILAGLRLGKRGQVAVKLLDSRLPDKPSMGKRNVEDALSQYQRWRDLQRHANSSVRH